MHMAVRRPRMVLLATGVAALILCGAAVAPSFAADWSSKVAPRVLQETAGGSPASFLVVMRSQANISAASGLATQEAKGLFVYRTLRSTADRTQAPIRALLDARGVRYQVHWAVNLITVLRGDRSLVQTLATRP